ncbi:MAG TPA: hypothetical protein VF109_08750 [Mycobacteriales bacterium]
MATTSRAAAAGERSRGIRRRLVVLLVPLVLPVLRAATGRPVRAAA